MRQTNESGGHAADGVARLLTVLPPVVLIGVSPVLVAVRIARGPGEDPTTPAAVATAAALPTAVGSAGQARRDAGPSGSGTIVR